MTTPSLGSAQVVLDALHAWMDTDEPLVEAVGNALDYYSRCDSQEKARRVVGTVISVLSDHIAPTKER